ncbi:MAG: 23S rRNA (uracil(1939)-C(5))-methyltransferase RlmD [Firmicutes bacterium]|nr:23S rRNA (uracil(1939)-C(5))-methyltransferase RlmD [Bacillota bacterium]
MCKKGTVLEAVIEETVYPNKGLVYHDGKRILVHEGLEGQKVRIRITRRRHGRTEAKILEILERSPFEQEAYCRQFGSCGGCAYLNVPYAEQLRIKAKQVEKLLLNAGISGFDFLGIEPSPRTTAYRNKMEYTFGDAGDGGLSLGLHRKRMRYEISPVDGCQLVDGDFLAILDLVLDYCRDLGLPFYHKKSREGLLRNLVIRKAHTTGEILVNLVTTSQAKLDLTKLGTKLESLALDGEIVGFLHTINDGKADAIRADFVNIIFGSSVIVEEILGLRFQISPFSFFQTNSLGAEKLYTIVRDFAGSMPGLVLDLYCGTGTIAQIISPLAHKVIGIEIIEEAVAAAKANAQSNNLDNCSFIAGDVLIELGNLAYKPDLIILDPPRGGVHPKALEKIMAMEAPHLVYVSCQPASLAKDLSVLQARGYRATLVMCVDMFPHTPHVETVVKLGYLPN